MEQVSIKSNSPLLSGEIIVENFWDITIIKVPTKVYSVIIYAEMRYSLAGLTNDMNMEYSIVFSYQITGMQNLTSENLYECLQRTDKRIREVFDFINKDSTPFNIPAFSSYKECEPQLEQKIEDFDNQQ